MDLHPSSDQSCRIENKFNLSVVQRPMTNRQRAEIQLEALLNEPEVSLPALTQRTSNRSSNDHISLNEASKLLNTQPFLLERIVTAIYASTKTELSMTEVHKLTRVLNSTMDVRAFLFFIILDDDNDRYITSSGLSQFYEKYLKVLETFDNDRLQEVIQMLLHKFHLDQVRKVVENKNKFCGFRNHVSILKNSFLLCLKIQHYSSLFHNLQFIRHGLLNQ
jgi:hypothetical protein